MIDLFGPAGDAALERLSRRSTLYAFDFDGTLAPIVPRPDDARAADSTVARLATLGAMVPTVLLTGRSVDDLRKRIAFTPLHLVGDHGAEGVPDALHHSLADSLSAHGGNAAHRAVVQAWQVQWATAAGPDAMEGMIVEPKKYSLSVHYRATADHDAARAAIEAAIARLSPAPRIIGGKCVFNLLPVGAPDKGTALQSLVKFEHCESAFFIGDDLTDESVFAIAPESWVTVRVGRSDRSAARYFIPEQADIDRCLDRLLATIEAAVTPRS